MVTDTALYRYPHHHTAQDTPDKVDYERPARVVRGLKWWCVIWRGRNEGLRDETIASGRT